MKLKNIITVLFVTSSLLTSCSKNDDPTIPNEEELITTLKYILTSDDGGEKVVLCFQDLDGNGGNTPTITKGTLKSNTTYIGELVLSNEQKTPSEDITSEIKNEGNDHQFFFQTTISNLKVTYNDQDTNKNPLGLKTTLITKNKGNGTLKITLRHMPNKLGNGVNNGDITNAGGETDIEVTFNITIQ